MPLGKACEMSGPCAGRSVHPAKMSHDDRLFFGELDHAPLGVTEVGVRSDGCDDDAAPAKLVEYRIATLHRDVEMEIADHFAMLALADGDGYTAEIDLAVAVGSLAEHVCTQDIDIKIAYIFPAAGKNGDGVAGWRSTHGCGSIIILKLGREAGESHHGHLF